MTKTKRQKDIAKMRKKRLAEEAQANKEGLRAAHKMLPKPSKHCGCTNRAGGSKVMHKSKQDALAWAVRHLRQGSGFRTYWCPKKPGVVHVATERDS